MKEVFAKLWRRYAKGQNGFTLAELIVVVAIIVGLAAAGAGAYVAFWWVGSDDVLDGPAHQVEARGVALVTDPELFPYSRTDLQVTVVPAETSIDDGSKAKSWIVTESPPAVGSVGAGAVSSASSNLSRKFLCRR